jgi:hypothetical protein
VLAVVDPTEDFVVDVTRQWDQSNGHDRYIDHDANNTSDEIVDSGSRQSVATAARPSLRIIVEQDVARSVNDSNHGTDDPDVQGPPVDSGIKAPDPLPEAVEKHADRKTGLAAIVDYAAELVEAAGDEVLAFASPTVILGQFDAISSALQNLNTTIENVGQSQSCLRFVQGVSIVSAVSLIYCAAQFTVEQRRQFDVDEWIQMDPDSFLARSP